LRELELELEMAEVLPEREALGSGLQLNIAVVPQLNLAVPVTVLSPGSAVGIAQLNSTTVGF
jgi:hypothetical protein